MIESGSGGDLVLKGNDLSVINGFQNMPYIGIFGGNPDQSTAGAKEPDEQALDFWGNHLFSPNKAKIQFNSELEMKLRGLAITSNSRIQIERTVLKDLAFMSDFAGLFVEVTLTGVDRILIYIRIDEPNNLQSNEFTYIWDSTNSELTTSTND